MRLWNLGCQATLYMYMYICALVHTCYWFTGDWYHPMQEFIAYGIMNIVGSFFSSFTAAGSLSRSSVQANAGGKTQLVGIISTGIILVVLVALGSLFYALPNVSASKPQSNRQVKNISVYVDVQCTVYVINGRVRVHGWSSLFVWFDTFKLTPTLYSHRYTEVLVIMVSCNVCMCNVVHSTWYREKDSNKANFVLKMHVIFETYWMYSNLIITMR